MTFLIAFNRLFDKVFLNRYADTDRETWFQVRGMALLLLAIGLCLPFALLLADDRPFLVVTISVMLVFDGLLLAAIRLGWQRFAVTGAVLGFWALVTVLVFSSPFFDRYEVYKLATFYLFILFISSLMVRRMGVTALLVALSVAAILLSSVIRGNYMPVEKDVPTPDDYFACVALVVLTLVIIRPTIDRHRRQLETVREEARERQQRAAELDAANRAIRQREEELTRLRNFLSDIIDAMPSVLVSVDDALCITRWNRQAAERMGPSAGEAMGQPIAVLMPSLADRMSRVRTAIDDGVAVSHNRDRVLTGNDVRFENMTVYPLSDPAAKGAVIRIDDVTEQVHLEELMVQNEKMRSVGGLAAGMAHEINNPLGGVLQNAAVIARRLREPIHANLAAAQEAGVDLEKMAAYLEKRQIFRMLDMVEASGLRAAEIVQHMLNFSRMAGAPAEEIRLDELLDRSLSLAATEYDLRKRYDFRKIEIVKAYAENLPPVSCESVKMEQVFLNILRNGAEAMQDAREKGLMSGEPRFILRTRRDRGFVAVDIEDNGPGMDEETRRRVFEPFYTTKEVGQGTGLGLAVSFFIVTAHHRGELSVESSPGKGARFHVRLPINPT